jgi:hypothetical protein
VFQTYVQITGISWVANRRWSIIWMNSCNCSFQYLLLQKIFTIEIYIFFPDTRPWISAVFYLIFGQEFFTMDLCICMGSEKSPIIYVSIIFSTQDCHGGKYYYVTWNLTTISSKSLSLTMCPSLIYIPLV